MTVLGTAAVAAAADYPPTTGTVVTDATQVTPTTAAAPAGAATGLPFTGSDSAELFFVGAAIAGAGALVIVRTHRGSRGHRGA